MVPHNLTPNAIAMKVEDMEKDASIFGFEETGFNPFLFDDMLPPHEAGDFDLVSELLSTSMSLQPGELVGQIESLPIMDSSVVLAGIPRDPLSHHQCEPPGGAKSRHLLPNAAPVSVKEETVLNQNNCQHSAPQPLSSRPPQPLEKFSPPVQVEQGPWAHNDLPRSALQSYTLQSKNQPSLETSTQVQGLPATDSNQPKGNHNMLASMNPNLAMAQIALNRIPSSSSGASNAIVGTSPESDYTEDGSQTKMRYSEGATASNYCHVCGRASNTIDLAACANTRIGLCRKVMCDKCLLLHQRSLFYYAKEPNSSWICMHCRNICPKRARCHQYQKNNLRRRLRNEKKAPKESKPNTPRKTTKKTIAKPQASKKASVQKVPTKDPNATAASQTGLGNMQMASSVGAASSSLAIPNGTAIYISGPNTAMQMGPSRQAGTEHSKRNTAGAFAHPPVSSTQFKSSESTPLLLANAPKSAGAKGFGTRNVSVAIPPPVKNLSDNANEVSPTGVANLVFAGPVGAENKKSLGKSTPNGEAHVEFGEYLHSEDL